MHALCFALLSLTAAGVAAQGADVVYVANPAEGTIYAIDTTVSPATATLIFEQRRFDAGDMVVGPDDWLYVCSPDEGIVFRFDPVNAPAGGFPYALGTVEVLDTTGVNAPQCGWFSDKGDLFLSDRNSSTAVWIYQDLVPLSLDAPPAQLVELVSASGDFYGFEGQGITQGAPGDLYFVDQANGTVGTLTFDPIFRFDAPTSAGPIIATSGLTDPVGIARTADGTFFIASGGEVTSYGTTPCGSFTFDGQTPQFLQITADDFLYVTSTSKKAATLWQIDAQSCGTAEPIITFSRPDFKPAMSGVALPRTFREKPGSETSNDPSLELVFSFWDHAYELSITPPDACSVVNPIIATEIPPDCLVDLINGGYIYLDNNDNPDAVSGVPVTYAGDGGVAQLYTLTGTCNDQEKEIGHAISAFTALVGNPRIVRCEFVFEPGFDYCNPPPVCTPDDTGCSPAYCELIELESFFPFNGVFPDDGRISGVKSATTSDFSEYFIADIDLADGFGDNTPGCFCGWEDPLPDVDFVDPDDPFFGLPFYNSGSAVPVKFRVAALPDGGTCAVDDPCDGAPYGYVTGAQILLSVAKIYDEFGEEDFVPISPTATSANTPGNIFGNPTSPSTPFHYNLDTSDYDPGVYQAVAVALTDNFRVEWTYFAIH
jgi:hypothetical protein